MKFVLKSALSCILCIAVFIVNMLSAMPLFDNNATGNDGIEESINEGASIDRILIDNGFSEDVVNKLSESTKRSLAEQLSGENETAFEVRGENVKDGFISTLAQVDEENLILIIVTEITKTEGEEVKEIKVKVYYEWVNLPTFRIQDPIIISWDSEKFTYKSGSFYSEDRYSTTVESDVLYKSRTLYHSKNNDSFRWDTNLIDFLEPHNGIVTELYGSGEITLKVNDGYRYYENLNVGVTYMHNVPIIKI